ncbi:conserved hypothetical protein [Trichinella spiralis]|uniref:hypothetical protein n=1 Tax=Trichinella spiralis TaxID=6334 RepID=UPI0001EFD386|nr:conserved hypothetical protein [Trichinella spiralis]
MINHLSTDENDNVKNLSENPLLRKCIQKSSMKRLKIRLIGSEAHPQPVTGHRSFDGLKTDRTASIINLMEMNHDYVDKSWTGGNGLSRSRACPTKRRLDIDSNSALWKWTAATVRTVVQLYLSGQSWWSCLKNERLGRQDVAFGRRLSFDVDQQANYCPLSQCPFTENPTRWSAWSPVDRCLDTGPLFFSTSAPINPSYRRPR